MQKRVRAVIIKDGKLLTIKRFKNDELYYIFPGGGVDEGEDEKSALIRECLEEVNVLVEVGEYLYKQTLEHDEIFFYKCKILSGIVGQGSGNEYKDMEDDNSYEPMWLDLTTIKNKNIKPIEILGLIM